MNLTLKTNSPTLLLNINDNDDVNINCNYAVVTINPELKARLLQLKEAREKEDVYRISIFNHVCNYLSEQEDEDSIDEDSISEQEIEAIEEFTNPRGGVRQIETPNLDGVPLVRTEVDLINITSSGVKFTAYVKHSEVSMWSKTISWKLIELIQF